MNSKKITEIITANGWKLLKKSPSCSYYQYRKSGYPSIIIPDHAETLSIAVIKQLEKITGLSF